MSLRRSWVYQSLGCVLGLLISASVGAQPLVAPTAAPPAQPPATSQAGAAQTPVEPAPPPPTSAAPAAPAPTPPAVPPGYMLVPIPNGTPQTPQAAQTRYDVVYPQPRGALPPGMELPYEDGDPIPPGYRLVKRNRRGLIIAGSIVAGIPWTFSVMAAVASDYDNKSGFLLVPVLGPWLMLAAGGASDDCDSGADPFDDCNDKAGLRSVLVLDAIIQTAGGAMFVSGFAFPRKRLVRTDVTVGMTPTRVGRDGYGVGLVGTF